MLPLSGWYQNGLRTILRRSGDRKASLEEVRSRKVTKAAVLADYGPTAAVEVTYTEFPLRSQSDTIWHMDINL